METKLIEHKKSKSNNWVKLDIRNRNSESKISTKNNFGFKKKPEWIRVKLPTGKKYSNLRGYIKKAVKEYAKDIKNRKFPTKNNIY